MAVGLQPRPWWPFPAGGFPAILPVLSATILSGGRSARFLQDEGVDVSGLVERPGHRSQFAFIASEPGGRRTIFWQRPTGEALRPPEIRMDILRASRVLHTDGLFIEAALAAASEAKRSGVP